MIQTWVALPEKDEEADPSFENYKPENIHSDAFLARQQNRLRKSSRRSRLEQLQNPLNRRKNRVVKEDRLQISDYGVSSKWAS